MTETMKKICMTASAISLICLSPAQAGTSQPQHPTKASAKAPKAKNPYEFVPIPREEHGYNGFQSTAILTQKDYAAFVKAVKKQKHWNEKDKFLAALNTPKIDFKTHALVLLRHTETGGGVIAKFAEPRQEGFVLTCKVIRKMPGPTGGAEPSCPTNATRWYAANPGTKKAYIRGRRYMPERQGLKGTQLKPDYSTPELFATGVKHHITVIKKDRDLYMRVENPDQVVYCHMTNPNLPVITAGRIGLRHMFTRSARYANFRVSVPQ